MLQIAIVEDDFSERKRIRECLSFLEQEEGLSFVVREFETGAAFLDKYRPEYDIVLMDIEMPGINGLETARELRQMDGEVILIFVTNMAQFALYGYEVEALDFILKPINRYSFALKLKRAVSRTGRKTEDYITIRMERESVSVRVASIRYLEVRGHYVVYHTTEGDYTEYTTLKEAAGRIGRDTFANTSRSFLVNLRYVDSVGKDTVMIGKDEIQISRPQKKAFLSAMSEYMGGKR